MKGKIVKVLDDIREEHELLTEIDSEQGLTLKDIIGFRLKLDGLQQKRYESQMGSQLKNVCLNLAIYWTLRLNDSVSEFISLDSMRRMYSQLQQ